MNILIYNLINNNIFYLLPYFLFAFGISTLLIALSYILVNQDMDLEKASGYECGFDPFNDARDPFYIQFYIIALLFIIFDIEVVFFVPFISSLKFIDWFGYFFMISFIIMLITSLYHEWNKKCIDF